MGTEGGRIEGRTYESNSIQTQIHPVPQLPAHSTVLEDRVPALDVRGHCGCLEVLHVLAQPHGLARQRELFLDRLIGRDHPVWVVGPVQVPGVEPREVL